MTTTEHWWLYMLECRGGSIYIGIAKDPEARYQKHLIGKGAKYTRINPPIRLLAKIMFASHRSAAQAEVAMKKLRPLEKWRWAAALSGDGNLSESRTDLQKSPPIDWARLQKILELV